MTVLLLHYRLDGLTIKVGVSIPLIFMGMERVLGPWWLVNMTLSCVLVLTTLSMRLK
ncbi:hypothetical protein LINPERHAP2_LOCUS8285 [Linum perenne]